MKRLTKRIKFMSKEIMPMPSNDICTTVIAVREAQSVHPTRWMSTGRHEQRRTIGMPESELNSTPGIESQMPC
jgi:hypothetical protein